MGNPIFCIFCATSVVAFVCGSGSVVAEETYLDDALRQLLDEVDSLSERQVDERLFSGLLGALRNFGRVAVSKAKNLFGRKPAAGSQAAGNTASKTNALDAASMVDHKPAQSPDKKPADEHPVEKKPAEADAPEEASSAGGSPLGLLSPALSLIKGDGEEGEETTKSAPEKAKTNSSPSPFSIKTSSSKAKR